MSVSVSKGGSNSRFKNFIDCLNDHHVLNMLRLNGVSYLTAASRGTVGSASTRFLVFKEVGLDITSTQVELSGAALFCLISGCRKGRIQNM